MCQYIDETIGFEDAGGYKYDIWKGVINCNTDFTVHKLHCSSCSRQHIRSNITDFWYWSNNYKSAFSKYLGEVNSNKLVKNTFTSTFNYLTSIVWVTEGKCWLTKMIIWRSL